MCWKTIVGWFKPDPIVPVTEFTKNTIVSVAVGDYQGSANDLDGPPFDQVDFKEKILALWPHYSFREYLNSQGTAVNFLEDLETGVSLIEEGDLLLFINDNCFSTTNTKGKHSPNILGHRFHPNPDLPRRKIIRSKAMSKAVNYLAMSACLENETAADAQFEHPNGAYTYALLKTLKKGITYYEWHMAALAFLKAQGFRQTCTLEGPVTLQNKLVFEGNVYCYYLSSHGTYTYDKDGDETDGQDEGPYLFDNMILDDTINSIISTNSYLI